LIPVDVLGDAPRVEDVLDPPSGARVVDFEPIAEDAALVGGEEVRRGRIGTEVVVYVVDRKKDCTSTTSSRWQRAAAILKRIFKFSAKRATSKRPTISRFRKPASVP
jgi:hypothetical protein